MTTTFIIAAILAGLAFANHIAADEADGDFVRLVAALDEPEFYCLDLAGWGRNLLLDDPLQTHTCKGRGGEDQREQDPPGPGAYTSPEELAAEKTAKREQRKADRKVVKLAQAEKRKTKIKKKDKKRAAKKAKSGNRKNK